VLRRGADSAAAIASLVRESGAQAVFFNHLYDSISMVRDQQVKDELRSMGVAVHSFNGDLLYEPWQVLDGDGQVRARALRGPRGARAARGGGPCARPGAERPGALGLLRCAGSKRVKSRAAPRRRRRRPAPRGPQPHQPRPTPQPYTTFKSYWDKCLAMPFPPALPLPEPAGSLPPVPEEVESLDIDEAR
jgi:hypothetical protein